MFSHPLLSHPRLEKLEPHRRTAHINRLSDRLRTILVQLWFRILEQVIEEVSYGGNAGETGEAGTCKQDAVPLRERLDQPGWGSRHWERWELFGSGRIRAPLFLSSTDSFPFDRQLLDLQFSLHGFEPQ